MELSHILHTLRLILLATGLVAVAVNSSRYVARAGRCLRGGVASLKCAAITRPVEMLGFNLAYSSSWGYALLILLFHATMLALLLSHLDTYLAALTRADINALAAADRPSPLKTVLAAAMGVAGLLLLLARAWRARRGLARLTRGVLALHALAQAIAWSWAAYHATCSPAALQAALLSVEAFHAYMLTWTGFHGVMFILRLYYSSKMLHQPPVIELG